MSDIERLEALNLQISAQQAVLEELQKEAEDIGSLIRCCARGCQCKDVARPNAGLPRGWLMMMCHCSGDYLHYCPDHWDSACLDDTDYWYSGGESIRLPYGKRRWWDEGKWRRIKKKFGAR